MNSSGFARMILTVILLGSALFALSPLSVSASNNAVETNQHSKIAR
jgi:hypothetical protein